jgi:hypothetical protein
MTRMTGLIVAALVLLGSLSASGVQEAPPANGSLEGVVVRIGDGNEAVGKASVELRGPQGAFLTTENDGRFNFTGLRPGSYRVVVRRDGYWPAEYGQRWVDGPGQPIALGANQKVSGARIVMTPGGVIAGRIANRAGQPMPGARVRAMRPTVDQNQRALQVIREAVANDLGEYRLSDLIPGRYYISATVIDPPASGATTLTLNPDAAAGEAGASRSTPRQVTARPPGNGLAEGEVYAPIFFPAVPDSRQAIAVNIDPGTEYRAADIFVYPTQTYHVRGVVANLQLLPGAQNAAGGARGEQPAPAAQQAPRGRGGAGGGATAVRLAPLDPNGSSYTTQVDAATGQFDFQQVVPGSYIAYMFVQGLTVRASSTVDVLGGDVAGVFMDVIPGINIPVDIRFDGEPPQGLPDVSSINLVLWRDPTLMGAPPIPLNGPTRAIENLALGDYRVYANPLLSPLRGIDSPTRTNWPNAYIKSIRLGDVDVLNGGLHLASHMDTVTRLITQAQAPETPDPKPPELMLEVIVGTNPGAVRGRVVNENQEPLASLTVTLLAENAANRIVRTDMYKVTSTDAMGQFEVKGLPPGDYKLFAWDGIEKGGWLDPVLVGQYEELGKPVRIEEGKIQTVELPGIRVR